jgi:hypothetical protein
MNDMQVQLITLYPCLVAIVKQAPGKGAGVFLTRSIVNHKDGSPPQTAGPSVGKACSAGVDQARN